MATRTRPSSPEFDTVTVFAAACAADRINNGYAKQDVTEFDEQGNFVGYKAVANKVLVWEFLNGKQEVLEEDRIRAEMVIKFCKATVTLKVLSDKYVSEFEQAMLKIAEKPVISSKYDLAVISSLPAAYERHLIRHAQDVKLREHSGCINAIVGEKIEMQIEVVRCNYSKQWEIFYVTAIADTGVIFFGFKREISIGEKITIRGRVKAHKEDRTQLSHVKIIN